MERIINSGMRTPWMASHRIMFTPAFGQPQAWLVMLQPHCRNSAGDMVAPTHGEWLSRSESAWTLTSDDRWVWRSLDSPRGIPGRISVEEVSGAHSIILDTAAH